MEGKVKHSDPPVKDSYTQPLFAEQRSLSRFVVGRGSVTSLGLPWWGRLNFLHCWSRNMSMLDLD